jgi:type II secretion system protein C
MTDDPNNKKDKPKVELSSLIKKASSFFSKKKNNKNDVETQESNSVLNENQEATTEINIQEDITTPAFNATDFDDDDSEIDRTLKSINLAQMREELEAEEEGEYEEVVEETKKPKSKILTNLFKKSKRREPIHEKSAKKESIISILMKKMSTPKKGGQSFAETFHRIFASNSRPTIHRNFILIFFALGAIFSARLIATLLSPKTQKSQGVAHTRTINVIAPELSQNLVALKQNDLFQTKKKAVSKPVEKDKPVVDQKLICKEAERRTSESFKLLQTIVLHDSVKSIASVQVRGKGQYLRIGDKVPGMAEIGNITKRKMIFKNLKSGLCEYIDSPEQGKKSKKNFKIEKNLKKGKKLLAGKPSGIKNDGDTFKIKKSYRDEMLGNISSLLTQARAVPMKQPDGTYHFRMVEIIPDSTYTKLGMQNGDIITSISGKKIESINEVMNYLGKLKTDDHFELRVKRNGVEKNFEYDFE